MQYSIVRPVAAMSATVLLALAAGCSRPADQSNASAAPTAPAQAATSTQGKTASKLGDLSSFHSIATDVAAIVDKGDLKSLGTRPRPDSSRARQTIGMCSTKPSTKHWLAARRCADAPNPADCKAAMGALLKSFGTLGGKA